MTQINYPDLTRVSPNGSLRLEIRSPDNDEVNPREDPENTSRWYWGGFQRDFTFTVLRNDSSEVIWQRTAGADDSLDAPCDAWVSEEGEVIVITRHPFSSDFFVLNAKGETLGRYDVAEGILCGDSREFRWTTAGPDWNQNGVGLFFKEGRGRYFCFRTMFGRQVLVNLVNGLLEDASTSVVAGGLRAAQADWAILTLRLATQEKTLFASEVDDPEQEFWEQMYLIRAAALLAGADRVSAAAPYLQQLEHAEIWGGCTSGWPMPSCPQTWFVEKLLVPIVKQSLRRLSIDPAGKSSYWLAEMSQDRSEYDLGPRIDVPECIADRHVGLAAIRPGMSRGEVVCSVGFPDVAWRPCWDYDELHATNGPCTFRITWDTDVVACIEQVPAAWQDVYSRVAWM